MKKRVLFIIVSLIALTAHGAFTEVSPSGHTLAYDWVNGKLAVIQSSVSNYGPSYYFSGNVIIPDSVNYNGGRYAVKLIGEKAFIRTTGIITVSIPSTVTAIGNRAFEGCTGLTGINIPSSVQSVGSSAFYNCTGLMAVTFNNPNTTIGSDAFSGCSSLTQVVLPDSLKILELSTFAGCSNLISITLPEGLTTIEQSALSGCGFSTIQLPDSLQSIATYAFHGCANLDSLHIPALVSNIAYATFWNCPTLSKITVDSGNTVFDSREGCNAIIESATNKLVLGCANTVIPSSVTSIGTKAFFINADGVSMTIPESVTNIYAEAFNYIGYLHFKSTVPPVCGGTLPVSYIMYVPCGSRSNYIANYSPSSYWVFEEGPEITLTVQVNDTRRGSFEFQRDDYGNIVRCDSTATMQVSPNYGYHFDHWSTGATEETYTLHLDGDSTIVAHFAKDTFLINGISNNTTRGTVVGGGFAEYLDSVQLTAIAKYGYHFVRWQGSGWTWTENPIKVDATYNKSYIAYFEPDIYSLTILEDSVSIAYDYPFLDTAIITAPTKTGYSFSHWNDGDINNPRIVIITQDTIFSVNYLKNIYTIESLSSDTSQGHVSAGGAVAYLDTIVLVATPKYGYKFNRWICTFDDGTVLYSWDDTLRMIVLTNTVVTAIFELDQFEVTVVADNERGTVYGGGRYYYGSEEQISASGNYGYHFEMWDDSITDNPRFINIWGDTVFTAFFAPNTYTIYTVANDDEMGTVLGGGEFVFHDTAELVAIPNEHYSFIQWNDGNMDNPRIVTVNGPATYYAYFAIEQHHLSAIPDNAAHGMVSGSGNYNYPGPATVQATPYSGYAFSHWSDGSTYNPYTFAVLCDTIMTAVFRVVGEPYQDTIFIYDTITLHDTVPVSYYYYDTVTLTDTVTLVQMDTLVTVDTLVQIDTVTVTDTLWMTLYDTITIHDTIIIHDTIVVGVDEVETINAKIYTSHGQIVVEGAEGNDVTFFDITGRRIQAIKQSSIVGRADGIPQTIHFDAPASGTYLIKIGNHPARKVVVKR